MLIYTYLYKYIYKYKLKLKYFCWFNRKKDVTIVTNKKNISTHLRILCET